MAIIRSSKKFEGGEFKQGSGSYLKSTARQMSFRDKKYADGAYVFILGAYKEDSTGNGVWYKPLKIRDNFGMDMIKEKFAVPQNCPIDYFAQKIRTYAPHLAKTEKVKNEKGQERNVYPAWGRTTWRVLYNAAYFNALGDGVYVLDLPQSGGASQIDDFVRGRTPEGLENPDITNYEAAYPVHIKLDLDAGGQPWKIGVNSTKAYSLPLELADSQYLFNLDDVINYPSKAELIEKLRSVVSPELFDKCMQGYSDPELTISVSHTAPLPAGPTPAPARRQPTPVPAAALAPAAEEDEIPFANPAPAPVARPAARGAVAPAFRAPKAAPAPVAPQVAEDPDAEPNPLDEEDTLPRPPVATTGSNAASIAKSFLRKPAA